MYPEPNRLLLNTTYESLAIKGLRDYQIIINCTPLGTFPDIHKCPTIPYEQITSNHLLFDLIYNPEETLFLKQGKTKMPRLSTDSKCSFASREIVGNMEFIIKKVI